MKTIYKFGLAAAVLFGKDALDVYDDLKKQEQNSLTGYHVTSTFAYPADVPRPTETVVPSLKTGSFPSNNLNRQINEQKSDIYSVKNIYHTYKAGFSNAILECTL